MILNDTLKANLLPRLKPFITAFLIIITLVLLVWAISSYRPPPNFYGPRAIYSLTFLSILLALSSRLLLLQLLKEETTEKVLQNRLRETWRSLFLFEITAPLFLAGGVMIGVPGAVIVSIVTHAFLQGYMLLRGYISWVAASYRIATTGLVVLISAIIYSSIGGAARNYFMVANFNIFAEYREFGGAFLASTVMTVLIGLVSLSILTQANHMNIGAAWREYSQSPVLRFQILVLSVGPLLPLADTFDDAAEELAWLLFLIPLLVICYMTLISIRLSIRTSELQQTLQDLSSARRRQVELRDYASLITRVQEEERRRLARELHDDTAQALIALSLGLDSLKRTMLHSSASEESALSDSPSSAYLASLHSPNVGHPLKLIPANTSRRVELSEKDIQWLSELQNLADRTLEGVRRACRDLRPSILDDLGLRAALEWLSDSSVTRGVPCKFVCLGSTQPTSSEAEIAIFRIVQESLSNIWRHASATHAEIELCYLPGQLRVTVLDNGKGFMPELVDLTSMHDSQSGLGLAGMRERAALIGAALTILSSPGAGSTVQVVLPL